MTWKDAVELLQKYGTCPKCGCATVGAGTGVIDIDTAAGYFRRGCSCGWSIEIREEVPSVAVQKHL